MLAFIIFLANVLECYSTFFYEAACTIIISFKILYWSSHLHVCIGFDLTLMTQTSTIYFKSIFFRKKIYRTNTATFADIYYSSCIFRKKKKCYRAQVICK